MNKLFNKIITKYLPLMMMFFMSCQLLLGQNIKFYKLKSYGITRKLPDELNANQLDSISIVSKLKEFKSDMIEEGFLSASLDSLIFRDKTAEAYFFQGQQFLWSELRQGNLDEAILTSIGFRNKIFQGIPFNAKQTSRLMDGVLNHFENIGHPFVKVRLDGVKIKDSILFAALNVEKGNLYKIDTVILKGSLTTNPRFIYNYVNVKPGDIYDASVIKKVDGRLKEIPFLKPIKKSELLFTQKKCSLFVYADDKNASQFDGILGILPDVQTGEITVTGDVKLNLKNGLKRGETILFNWRKLQTNTQDLVINLNYPFVFNLPFGLDLNTKIYRRDTTFSEQMVNAGLQYLINGNNYLQVFYRNKSSNVLANSLVQNGGSGFSDASLTSYGLAFNFENLDYRFNPRKGYGINISAEVGNKEIQYDPLTNVENESITTTQYELKGNLKYFLPIQKRSTIMLTGQGSALINLLILENELYRFGGIKILRGFDEESLSASRYGVATLEYRYLLEQNSNIYLFVDQAFYERKTTVKDEGDQPISFGAGMSFETKAGIFSINYALGKQQGNPFLLRSAKVHFGFVSLF